MLSLRVCTDALNVEDAKLRSGFVKIRDPANTVHPTPKPHVFQALLKIYNVMFDEALRLDLWVSDSCHFV